MIERLRWLVMTIAALVSVGLVSAAEPAPAATEVPAPAEVPAPTDGLATTRALVAAAGGYEREFTLKLGAHVAVPFYRHARDEIHGPDYTQMPPDERMRLLSVVQTHLFAGRLDLVAALGDESAALLAWQTFMLVAMAHEHGHGLRDIASVGGWAHWPEEIVAIRFEQAVLRAAVAAGEWPAVTADRYLAFNQALWTAIDPALIASLPARGSDEEAALFARDLAAVAQALHAITAHLLTGRPITPTTAASIDGDACQRVMATYTRERLERWTQSAEDLAPLLRELGLGADQVTPEPARGPKIR